MELVVKYLNRKYGDKIFDLKIIDDNKNEIAWILIICRKKFEKKNIY